MEVSTKQQRIAELAKRRPEVSFTSLNQYLDSEWLKEAYQRLRKDSAPGYDGQTVEDYGGRLDANLQSLLERAKSGSYYAPPVKRVHIPKGTGKETRPIGVPVTEDKLLQRAIAMILEPIYEQDFLDCSYGFRPGRSAHDALEAIWRQCNGLNIQWILDIDIRKFFDTLKHDHLREFLRHRVRDGVITKLVGKWLKAGVCEQGAIHYPEDGTPQGGCISPLLSNIYLHYVLDLWFANAVKPGIIGRAFMTRYADDVVMGFEYREDAEKVLRLLSKRLEQYGLVLHPEKTRLIFFARPRGVQGDEQETFDFLGFTHYWGKSRRGKWVIKRKTSRSRFNRGLKRIAEWCRLNRHEPVAEQHRTLCRKLQGHFAYYGITGNGPWLEEYKEGVKKLWYKWLNRRSNKASMPWGRFNCLLKQYRLPPARVVHSIYVAKP
jgi:RNA-directed DNA polymerase